MSKIEWTDETWNPIAARHRETGKIGWHCEKVSEACKNCYAEKFNGRGLPNGGTGLRYTRESRDQIEIVERNLEQPLHWRKPRKIFVCSMTDLFGEFVPFDLIDRVFAVMALCPQHTFQVLTKRPERALEWSKVGRCAEAIITLRTRIEGRSPVVVPLENIPLGGSWYPLPNVWIGVTAEDQQRADERIPTLLQIPAAKRFVSYEPALGPLHVEPWLTRERDPVDDDYQDFQGLDWVICGGESGPGARPMHPDWARSVRDQCAAAGVPFFFKQWGDFRPCWGPEDGIIYRTDGTYIPDESHEHPDCWRLKKAEPVERVGKRVAGRLIDGREHMEFPL